MKFFEYKSILITCFKHNLNREEFKKRRAQITCALALPRTQRLSEIRRMQPLYFDHNYIGGNCEALCICKQNSTHVRTDTIAHATRKTHTAPAALVLLSFIQLETAIPTTFVGIIVSVSVMYMFFFFLNQFTIKTSSLI